MYKVVVTTNASQISHLDLIKVLRQQGNLSLSEAVHFTSTLLRGTSASITLPFVSLQEATTYDAASKNIGLSSEIFEISKSEFDEMQAKIHEPPIWKQRERCLSAKGISLPVAHISRNTLSQNFEAVKNSLDKNPMDVTANLYIAGLYLVEDKEQEAIAACLTAISALESRDISGNFVLACKMAFAHYLLGCAYLSNKQIEQARAEWEIALQISADLPLRSGFSLDARDIITKSKLMLNKHQHQT